MCLQAVARSGSGGVVPRGPKARCSNMGITMLALSSAAPALPPSGRDESFGTAVSTAAAEQPVEAAPAGADSNSQVPEEDASAALLDYEAAANAAAAAAEDLAASEQVAAARDCGA